MAFQIAAVKVLHKSAQAVWVCSHCGFMIGPAAFIPRPDECMWCDASPEEQASARALIAVQRLPNT